MAGIPQIPGVGSKSYTPSTRPIEGQQAVFDLGGVGQLPKAVPVTGAKTENGSGFRKGNALPEPKTQMLRDPAISSKELLRLFSDSGLAALSGSGDSALAEDAKALAASLFLPSEELPGEIGSQQRMMTLFRGGLFEALRSMLAGGADDTLKALIAGVLKTSSQLQLNGEALASVSANLKQLARMLAANEGLSGRLLTLADAFAKSPAGEDFAALRDQTTALLDEAGRSLLSTDAAKKLSSLVKYNLSRVGGSVALLHDQMDALLSQIGDPVQRQKLSEAFARYAVREGYQSPQMAPSREVPGTVALAALLERSAEALAASADKIASLLDAMERGAPPEQTIRSMLEALAEASKSTALLPLAVKELRSAETLQDVVDQLNLLLRSLPEGELRSSLFEGFSRAVELMHARGYLHDSDHAPELLALAEFLTKHQAQPALRGLDGFDFSSLLQNMLRAPGMTTPLAHYLLPAKEGDTRAMAELWVDPEAKGSSRGGETGTKLFLVFDVDTVGRFELEIFVRGRELAVGLYCPPAMKSSFDGLRSAIGRAVAHAGYQLGEAQVRPLMRARELSEVFPKLKESEVGIDVVV